jgi:hypothetical protein
VKILMIFLVPLGKANVRLVDCESLMHKVRRLVKS